MLKLQKGVFGTSLNNNTRTLEIPARLLVNWMWFCSSFENEPTIAKHEEPNPNA